MNDSDNWYELGKDPINVVYWVPYKEHIYGNVGNVRRYEPHVTGNWYIQSCLPHHYDDNAYMAADTTGSIFKSTKYKRDWYERYMVNKVCTICNESARCCLEHHHKDPTSKVDTSRSISKMIDSKYVTIDNIMDEMKLCILLCKNCHTKVHAGVLTINTDFFE